MNRKHYNICQTYNNCDEISLVRTNLHKNDLFVTSTMSIIPKCINSAINNICVFLSN